MTRKEFKALARIPRSIKDPGQNVFRSKIGLTTYLTTSSAGILDYRANCSTINSIAEFANFVTQFDEFFVLSMDVHYEPYGQYIGAPAMTSLVINSTQLYAVSLYHGTSPYTTAAPAPAMLNNSTLRLLSSGRPFSYKWINNEDPTSDVANSTSNASQHWQLTTNANVYSGTIQIQAGSTIGSTTVSQTIGTAAVIYDVIFRARA
jgi:hypothetical protein